MLENLCCIRHNYYNEASSLKDQNENKMTIKKYFCFELVTAGLVIGWLGLVKSATTSASLITMLIDPDYYISYKDYPSLSPMMLRSVIINIFATSLALSIFEFAASLMLVIASIKKNHLLLVPWLLNSGFSLLYSSAIVTGAVVFLTTTPDTDLSTVLTVFGIGSVLLIFSFYTWIAVYSLYRVFKGNEENSEHQRLLNSNQPPAYNTKG